LKGGTVSKCKPDCPICGGYGYYRKKDKDGNIDFSKLYPCPNSPGFLAGTGLSAGDNGMSFEDLQENVAVNNMVAALKELLEAEHGMLYIYGNYGLGKTHCIKAATIIAAKKGLDVLYMRQNVLADDLRSAYDEEKAQQAYRERMKYYGKMRWLAIDEYGRERTTEFSKNAFEELIDVRYEGAIKGNLMTVIVSNFAPEDAANEYIADRLRDKRCKVLQVIGTSWRKEGSV
jgi:DNA replication protein DnaC